MSSDQSARSWSLWLVLAALCTGYAHAHHSRSEYNFSVITEVSGEILSVKWQNPHIELRLKTTADDGSAVEWHLESASAVAMNQAGVSADMLRSGMNVRVAGASTRRPHRMEVRHVLLPDGVEVVFGWYAPRWSSRSVGSSLDSRTPSGKLPEDGRGIFRVWALEPVTDMWMLRPPGAFPLTDKAKTLAADWNEDDPDDSLALRCIAPGVPSTMGSPHPMEIVDRDGVIEIHNEEFDVVRTIHLAPAADPATVPLSPLGHSVGRWEGDTLVVETTRLNAPYFTRRGVPQSESARVVERFSVDAQRGRLTEVFTFWDPEYLTEPVVEELHWVWNERARVQRFDCKVTE